MDDLTEKCELPGCGRPLRVYITARAADGVPREIGLCHKHAAIARGTAYLPDAAEVERVARALLGIDSFEPPYSIIPMPCNAAGAGPEMDPAMVAYTVYEVWDACCRTVSAWPSRAAAVAALEKLVGAAKAAGA